MAGSPERDVHAGHSRFAIWALAVRPKTLLLSITPVISGTALALLETGEANAVAFILAAIAAAAIQIATNLWNDACDGASGLDDEGRLGPKRVTQAGLLSAAQVRRGAIGTFLLAAVCGVGLILIGGVPILVIGILSIICGLLYSAGPHPISATPFGELFVLVFFGVVAVSGTYFLHAGMVTAPSLVMGLIVGWPAAAVLLINNHRDREGDARNGRRTLAIVAGIDASRWLFGGFLGVAVLSAAALVACWQGWMLLLPATIAALILFKVTYRRPISSALNATLAHTAAFQALLASSTLIALAICR